VARPLNKTKKRKKRTNLPKGNIVEAQTSVPHVSANRQTNRPDHDDTVNFAFLLVWFFAFEAFVRLEDIFPIIKSVRPALVLGIGATVAYARNVIRGRARFQWSTELVLILSLTVCFIAGIPFSYFRSGSFDVLMNVWIRTLLLFFLFTQTLTTVGRVRMIVWAVLLSELIASVASLLVRGDSAYDLGGRFTGINKGLLGWNYLGITLAVTIPFIGYLYVSRRSAVQRGLLFAILGSTTWMLVLTASRGGVFGIILSLILTWWFLIRGTPRSRLLIALVVLCLVVAAAEAPAVFWERLTAGSHSASKGNETAESAEESTEGRRQLLQNSLEDTLHHPIFGLGIGSFPIYHGSKGDPFGWLGTHNTFTQISSETGLPGLLLVVFLIGTVIWHMRRVSEGLANDPANVELRLLAKATLVSTVVFVFSGFFAHLGYDYLLYYIMGIAAGVWTITRHRLEVSRVNVPAPWVRTRHSSTKRVFQWH
jgi:O-antigen ligase